MRKYCVGCEITDEKFTLFEVMKKSNEQFINVETKEVCLVKDKLLEIISETFVIQNKLNTITCGVDWKSGFCKTDNGRKKTDFNTAILVESVELLDSYPWAHWKNINNEIDNNNVIVELCDIYHFLLSVMIANNIAYRNIDKFFTHIPKNFYDVDDKISAIKKFILKILELGNFNNTVSDPHNNLILNFMQLLANLNVNFIDVLELFYAKSALNRLRQENGYKEGLYKKIWDGNEDNVFMYNMVKDGVDKDDFYTTLKEKYESLI